MNKQIESLSKAQINALYKSILDRTTSKVQIRTMQTGRKRYVEKFNEMLSTVIETNESYSKFIIADYGVGKSFLIEMLIDISKQEKFLVSKVDLSPDRLLYHEKKALTTYGAIMSRLECKGTTSAIEKLLQDICRQSLKDVGNVNTGKIRNDIMEKTEHIRYMQYGEDFVKVICRYATAYFEDDKLTMSNCLKWIKGEYESKLNLRRDLGIDTIIASDNYRQMLQIINKIGILCGFNGLVVFFDECVNIKDAHQLTRKKNYEAILNMYNETTQGELQNCIFFFSGDVEFLTNEQKGLFSYDALKQRLNNDDIDYIDLESNIWRVKYLTIREQQELIRLIIDVYEAKFEKNYNITDEQIKLYVMKKNKGFSYENIVTRDIISKVTQLLNKINNGDATFDDTQMISKETTQQEKTIIGLDDAF